MSATFTACRLLTLPAVLWLGLSAAPPAQRAGAGADFAPIGMELLPALRRARDAGPANSEQVLHLAVSLPYARPEAMQAFCDSVSDPRSPDYRKFITPEEVGARFGPSRAQIQQVADYLARNGFEITLVAKNRLAVLANATVAQAEAAFHTTIRAYTLVPQDEVEPSQFVANSRPVLLPAELAALVIDVSGLETYTRPKHITTLLTPDLTRGLYDTVNMYNAGNQGQGRTIGISNWDGFRANNYMLYISHFSLPVPAGGAGSNIAVIPCGGGGAGAGPAGAEGDLDIQMELGMAPLASIKIYDGTQAGNLVATLTQEVNDNLADVISESYGWNISSSTANSAHNQHLSMTAQGITYMAASGDSGTSLEPFSYPDYEPEALSIGGTVANVNSSNGARISEVGWSGSGGGWSTNGASFNVRPSWQVGTGVLPLNGTTNHRLVPDVGFHAAGSGNPGGAYQFYYQSMLRSDFIGTSFASPIFTGMLAVIEQKIISLGGLPPDANGKRRFGRIQDLFYSQNGRSDVWHDITSGGNGNRPDGSASVCTTGWDTVTGWGPMDCEAFVTVRPAPPTATATGRPIARTAARTTRTRSLPASAAAACRTPTRTATGRPTATTAARTIRTRSRRDSAAAASPTSTPTGMASPTASTTAPRSRTPARGTATTTASATPARSPPAPRLQRQRHPRQLRHRLGHEPGPEPGRRPRLLRAGRHALLLRRRHGRGLPVRELGRARSRLRELDRPERPDLRDRHDEPGHDRPVRERRAAERADDHHAGHHEHLARPLRRRPALRRRYLRSASTRSTRSRASCTRRTPAIPPSPRARPPWATRSLREGSATT